MILVCAGGCWWLLVAAGGCWCLLLCPQRSKKIASKVTSLN